MRLLQKLAKQTALDEFQQKLADEKAAAAASTAAYQSKLANDAMVEELMDALAERDWKLMHLKHNWQQNLQPKK